MELQTKMRPFNEFTGRVMHAFLRAVLRERPDRDGALLANTTLASQINHVTVTAPLPINRAI